MNKTEILNKLDHTVLKQTTTQNDIKKLCDDAIKNRVASVCIPQCYVKYASEYLKGEIAVCTVIGFPNGNMTTETKIFETENAINNGAFEIDMVINIGFLKDKKYDEILNEIKSIKKVCKDKVLKVIIETCLLTDEEKIKMCEIVSQSGADYIKTSTGFSSGGATFEDVSLMVKHVSNGVLVKASGGIASVDDAIQFIKIGANRLGTSRLIGLLNNVDDKNLSY